MDSLQPWMLSRATRRVTWTRLWITGDLPVQARGTTRRSKSKRPPGGGLLCSARSGRNAIRRFRRSTATLTSTTTSVCSATRHGAVADGLQRAVGHAHLRLRDLEAMLVQRFGDVGVGDRAEQAAVDAGLLRELDGRAAELLALRLRGGQLVGGGLLEFGALGFELP